MSPIYTPGKVVLRGPTVNPLLLDSYAGAAAAYSLRQLSWAYGGSVIRVRRSSDNAEQDFTAAQVTDGTLTTFCGVGNGFVRTWYDQSGNANNAEQLTIALQPQIVSAGSLLLEAGKPVVRFDGSNDFLAQIRSTTISQPFTTIAAVKRVTGGASVNENIFRAPSGGSSAVLYWSNGLLSAFAGNNVSLGDSTTNNLLVSVVWSGANSKQNLNGAQSTINLGTGYLTNAEPLRIGIATSGECCSMSLREFIIYSSDQAATLAGVSSNINAHYAIY